MKNLAFQICVCVRYLVYIKGDSATQSIINDWKSDDFRLLPDLGSETDDPFETSTRFDGLFNGAVKGPGPSTIARDMPLYGGLLVDKKYPNFTIIRPKPNVTVQTIRARLQKINPAPQGKVFRVATLLEPPFVAYYNLSDDARNSHRTGPGIVIEILATMQKMHNFYYDFFLPPDGVWGEPNAQNQWDGMFGMLQRNEVEMIAGASIVRYDRHAAADYSYPFYASETGMLIRSPDRYIDNRFLIVTAPFKWEVWALTALAVVVSGGIMKALALALQSANEIRYSWWEATWVFFSVFVQQGLPAQPKSWTCRTLLAFWWLAALTLVATFTGNMVALFAVSRSYLPFNTQEEMVYKVRHYGYKVVITNTSVTRIKFIQNSEQTLFRQLWYEMSVKGKWINVSTYEQGIELVKARPNMVLLGPKETLQVYAARDCNVTLTSGGLIPVMYSIALKKKSNFTELFSHEIRDLVEMGFITKWWSDYAYALSTERGALCSSGEGVTNAGDAIDINRAQGAFWILLGGVIIAAAGFMFEYAIHLSKKALHAIRVKMHKVIDNHRDPIDRYQKAYNGQESSRSYQPSTAFNGMVLPVDVDGKLHELKFRRVTANTEVMRF